MKKYLKAHAGVKKRYKGKRRGGGVAGDIIAAIASAFTNLPTPLQVVHFARDHLLSIPQVISGVKDVFHAGKGAISDLTHEAKQLGRSPFSAKLHDLFYQNTPRWFSIGHGLKKGRKNRRHKKRRGSAILH